MLLENSLLNCVNKCKRLASKFKNGRNYPVLPLQADHSPDDVKFPHISLAVQGTRHVKCYSYHRLPVL